MLTLLALVHLAAFAGAPADCPAAPRPDSVQLAPGQSATRVIRACDKVNHTGIWLTRNAVYDFRADGKWRDANIESGPEGYAPSAAPWYSRWVLFVSQPIRRDSHARWFELVGEVPAGSKHHVRIGRERHAWTATENGELTAFANDVAFMYGNNRDSVTLTVTRVR